MWLFGGVANNKTFILAAILGIVFSLFPVANAQIYGPKMLIQEQVYCDYWPNGTEKAGTLSRTGQMFVSVPNNDDVLQYIRITLDSGYNTNTNLQNDTVYQDALASYPNDNDWEYLYVNTTNSYSDTSYNIDDDAPTINFSLEFKNQAGGIDLYDNLNIDQGHNLYYLNLTISNEHASRTLNSISVNMYFDRDTNGAHDAVNIYQDPVAESGTASRSDVDGDGDYDHVSWTGSLSGGQSVNITILLNITESVNFAADLLNLDGNGETEFTADKGATSTYSATGTLFSGITVADKFARGPVRQGVDLSSNAGYWYVRGFIKNMGNADSGQNLTYNVTAWRIYDINPSTGAPQNVLQEGAFNKSGPSSAHITPGDGRIYTTNDSRSSNTTIYNTSSTTKPYIAVYFEWEVIWNSSNSENNLTYINTTLDLPTLYLLDLTQEETISGTVSPEVGGENITINETLTNVGSNETSPHFVQILSYVPSNTTNGDFRHEGGESFSWFIHSDVQIWLNSTYRLNNDSSNCIVTITQTSEGGDGLVNLSIYDLSACTFYGTSNTVGHTFDENNVVTLIYKVESNSQMRTGDSYQWYSIGQLNSSTDTQDREYALTNQTVQVAGKRVTGYKDLVGYHPDIPTLINTSILVRVEDTSGTGITGIKFIDYVPVNTISYEDYRGNVTVFYYDGSTETKWTIHTNNQYEITDNGTAKTPDGLNVHMFEFVNYSTTDGNTTWNLSNGQYIRISYQINFTSPGLYVLPVTIAAFDPDTGASLNTAFYGIIKVILPESDLPLQIDEDDLKQSKTVLVGKPVMWNKRFDVYNPNPRTVNTRFQTEVFDDATDGYVTYIDDNGKRIEEKIGFANNPDGKKVMYWDTVMKPFETRNYEVTVITPPVLEIDRDVDVLEQLPEKKVRLKMNIYLKSFAHEDYENVILNLPISYSKIEEVRDGFGNRLPFTGGKDTTSITVDKMPAGELKTLTLVYVESYPTIIITPDRDRYNLNSPVSLEILVINGGEDIEYPYLEIEIYTPGMDVIFTDITKLKKMEPLEKTELYQKFVIPATAPAGNYIAQARFREDFAVLASATGNFYVMGVEGGIPGALEGLMVLLAMAVLGYFSYRRLKEVRSSRQSYGGI